MDGTAKNQKLLLTAFLALLAVPALYLLRAFDDNTLTSWKWALNGAVMLRTFGLTAAGVAAAFFLAGKAMTKRRAGLLLFVLSFAAIVPLWAEPEVILDTSRYFLQAKHVELYGVRSFYEQWGKGISVWTDLPLVPLLYGLIFRWLGEARLFIQLFTTALFSLTVLLTCRIGEKLWDRETGFYAALLLLAIPYLLTQVPLMLIDVPAMFFVTLSIYTFMDAVEKGGLSRACLAALSLALCLFTKYSVPLMLPVLPLVTLVCLGRGTQGAAGRSAMIAASAGLIAAALACGKTGVFRQQAELLLAYQLPGLSRWKESLASTFLFQVHPFVTLLAASAVFAAVRKKDVRFLVPAWFAVFGLRVERIRYILPLFPLLTLAAAYGLREFKEREVRRFIAFSAVAASLALVLGAYLPFLKCTSMANLERAGRFLDSLPGERALVRVLPQHESSGDTEAAVPILDLYTKKRLFYERRERPTPDGKAGTSPLRFTWECPLPGYYSDGGAEGPAPLVVVSSSVPDGPGAFVRFAADSGTFKFRTVVTVYQDKDLAETAQARN